ncbi:MAG TPA: hypothetical protein VGN07_09670 [Steroidobacteraceae bacterium]|jgi:hypothetical protein
MSHSPQDMVPTIRNRAWMTQVWEDFLKTFLADAASATPVAVLRGLVLLVSVFMLLYPVYVVVDNLDQGVLLISPALFFMVIGGCVGFGMIINLPADIS